MNVQKTWLVARMTYRRRIRSGTFLILTFGIPLLMVIAGAIPLIREGGDSLPAIGYVDRTGRLSPVEHVSVEDAELNLTAYADVEAARAGVEREEVTGYLLVPEGYFEGAVPVFYGEEEPSLTLEDGLTAFLRRAMLPQADVARLARLTDPVNLIYIASTSGNQVSEGIGLVIRFGTPALLAIVFVLTVFTGASQMGSAVVQEKDQRAMEMVITSLSPLELVSGKVLGMTLLSLTQVGIWGLGAGMAAGLALSGWSDAQSLSIPWSGLGRALAWAVLLGTPGYFLYATLASGLGIIAGDQQQARQLAGMLGFLGMSPIYMMGMLVEAIDGPLAVGLTLFPLTAPMIALFRMALTDVPLWQLATSLGLLVLSLTGSVWLVARIFRAAMLMYGQSLDPRQVLRALREA
jgi:ABC-2 type transport system permease protein